MLYQEIRPETFDLVIGNNSTIGSLRKLVKRKPKDRPHTILLSGPRGCGKTTLGRIIAKEFKAAGDKAQELNAADVRGIDAVRAIADQISFRPIGGGTTVYILDECHRLTKDAQSALLKITEDTPEHVYFILCTTDPQLLLPTLRNRCSKYEVEPLKSKNILQILKNACKERDLDIDEEILDIISKNCDRTPRTALVLLEKIMDLTNLDEIADVIVSEIKIQEGGVFFDLCKLLLLHPEKRKKNWQKILNEYYKLNSETEQIKAGLLTFMRKQLIKIDPNDIEYAKDVGRTIEILSTNTYYGGTNLMIALLLKICLGE